MQLSIVRNGRALRTVCTREELGKILNISPEFIAAVIADKRSHYGYFEIPKSNGKVRRIQPPKAKLKLAQRSLLNFLYKSIRIPAFLHGGVPGRSPVSHARVHVGKRMVATLDIRDFFPSTRECHLSTFLQEVGFRDEALRDVIELATLDGTLTQGSPSSCLLANLSFLSADIAFRKVCRRYYLAYTRYVDDIAISGGSDFCHLKGLFIQIAKSSGYDVAENKTQFNLQGNRQVITGLIVNDKMRPTREYIWALKQDIHLCREAGPSFVADLHGLAVPAIKSQLNGRIAHLRRCDERLGRRLQRLLNDVPWKKNLVGARK